MSNSNPALRHALNIYSITASYVAIDALLKHHLLPRPMVLHSKCRYKRRVCKLSYKNASCFAKQFSEKQCLSNCVSNFLHINRSNRKLLMLEMNK